MSLNIPSPTEYKEEEHRIGDRVFAAAVRKLQIKEVSPATDIADKRFVQIQIKSMTRYFGKNDEHVVPQACAKLMKIGQAVAAQRTPDQYYDEISKAFREMKNEMDFYVGKSVDEYEQLASKELNRPSITTKIIAYNSVYRWFRNNKPASASKSLTLRLEPKSFKREKEKKHRQLYSAQNKMIHALRAIDQQWGGNEWYTGIGTDHHRWKGRCIESLAECKNKVEMAEQTARQSLEKRAFYLAPDWWIGSIMDAIGRELTKAQVKLTCVLMIIPAILFSLISYASTGSILASIFFGVGIPWIICHKLYKWNAISVAVRSEIEFWCSRCGQKYTIWNGYSAHYSHMEMSCSQCGEDITQIFRMRL